ncbi:MAG: hypothetical protein AB1540_13450 [Bdellovibrionota bacterium]
MKNALFILLASLYASNPSFAADQPPGGSFHNNKTLDFTLEFWGRDKSYSLRTLGSAELEEWIKEKYKRFQPWSLEDFTRNNATGFDSRENPRLHEEPYYRGVVAISETGITLGYVLTTWDLSRDPYQANFRLIIEPDLPVAERYRIFHKLMTHMRMNLKRSGFFEVPLQDTQIASQLGLVLRNSDPPYRHPYPYIEHETIFVDPAGKNRFDLSDRGLVRIVFGEKPNLRKDGIAVCSRHLEP